jgi:hypothetical protein
VSCSRGRSQAKQQTFLTIDLKNYLQSRVVSFSKLLDCVIPAWSAGIQADMDVSGRILRTWMPAIHAGMTKISIFMFRGRA